MIDNPKGGYRFLKGGPPFSSGCRAAPGYEIVHVVLSSLQPLDDGYGVIEDYLRQQGRPMHALCGMELRIPEPLSIGGFDDFNGPYIEKLKAWDLLVDGMNPVARTNVAPRSNQAAGPSLYGFSYSIETDQHQPTLITAGAGELRSSRLADSEIVRLGDTSPEGFAEKVETVLGIMSKRLAGMEADWPQVTAVDIYTLHPIDGMIESKMLPHMNRADREGFRWFFARPPVIGIDFEMDVRVVRQEVVLPQET
jgi:hypothetical protein